VEAVKKTISPATNFDGRTSDPTAQQQHSSTAATATAAGKKD